MNKYIKFVNGVVTKMRHFERYGETMNKREYPTQQFCFRICNEYAEKMKSIAKAKNITISSIVREVMTKWLDEYTEYNE